MQAKGTAAAKAQCTYSILDGSSRKSWWWWWGGDRGRMAKRTLSLSWHCPVSLATLPPCLASLGLGWEDFCRLPHAQHRLRQQHWLASKKGARTDWVPLLSTCSSPPLSQCSWWVVLASPFYPRGNRVMKLRKLSGSDISKVVGQGLSTYYVLCNILDTKYTTMNKQTKPPVLKEFIF